MSTGSAAPCGSEGPSGRSEGLSSDALGFRIQQEFNILLAESLAAAIGKMILMAHRWSEYYEVPLIDFILLSQGLMKREPLKITVVSDPGGTYGLHGVGR